MKYLLLQTKPQQMEKKQIVFNNNTLQIHLFFPVSYFREQKRMKYIECHLSHPRQKFIHPSIWPALMNSYYVSGKMLGKEIWKNSYCCWGGKTSRNKLHQHLFCEYKEKLFPLLQLSLRITLSRKYCLTDWEHWGPQSLSDLSKYINPAVGGARIQTQVFWPKTFPQYCVRMCRKGFSLASPHNRWALSICMQNSTWVPYFLLACSQKTVCVGLYHKLSWAHWHSIKLHITRTTTNDRRDGNTIVEGIFASLSQPMTDTVNKT